MPGVRRRSTGSRAWSADVGYLGGVTTYRIRLETGAVVRSSMANTARLDIDAYLAGQRVVAWFTPGRLFGAGAMSARHIFARPARFAAIAPYVWMVLFFLVPFGFVLENQPVADRDCAAALHAGVRFHRRVLRRSRRRFGELSLDNFRLLISDNIYILSYLRSLVVAVTSTVILLLIGYPIAYGMARLPQRLAERGDDARDRAVLDLVFDPHLCLDQHPAA